MNETELQKLVVRMVGDAKSYIKMLEDARSHTKQAVHEIEGAGKKVKEFQEGLEKFGSSMERNLAAVGIAFGFKEAFEKFEEFEKNQIRMEAVLKANEREVDATADRYRKFAKQLADTTTASKGQVMALLEQAETYGLTGAKAEKAAKDALSASKIVRDSSAEGLLRFSQAIAQGDMERAKAYARMIPQLRGVKDESELLEKWNKLVAAGAVVMGKEMETAGAKLEKAKQQMGAIGREIGAVLAEAIGPAATFVHKQASAFNSMSKESRDTVVNLSAVASGLLAIAAVGPRVASTAASVKNLATAAALNPYMWVAGSVIALGYLLARVTGLTESVKQYNEAVKHSEEMTEKLSSINDKRQAKELTGLRGQGPGAYDAAIARTSKQLNDYREKLEQVKAVRDEWFPSIARYQAAGQSAKDYEAQIKSLESHLQKLKEQAEGTGASLAGTGNVGKMQTMLKDLNTQIGQIGNTYETAFQKAAAEGLNRAQAGIVAQRTVVLELAKSYKQAKDNIQDFIDEQRKLNAQAGMTEAEKAVDNLRRAIDKYKQGTKVDPAVLTALEVAKKLAEAQEKSSEAIKRGNELLSEGIALRERFKSPQEKLAEQEQKLNALRWLGVLTMEQYNKALAEVKKQLMGVAAAQRDAAEGAEAMGRIYDYANNQGVFGQFPAAPKAAAPAPAIPWQRPDNPANWGQQQGGGLGVNGNAMLQQLQQINQKLGGPGIKVVKVGPGG